VDAELCAAHVKKVDSQVLDDQPGHGRGRGCGSLRRGALVTVAVAVAAAAAAVDADQLPVGQGHLVERHGRDGVGPAPGVCVCGRARRWWGVVKGARSLLPANDKAAATPSK
jgi:hypothetical protein